MNRKKKVLHIAQSAGGVERYIRMFLENVDDSLYSNILLCSYDYNKEDFRGTVDEFIQIDMKREISAISDLDSISKIRRIIKELEPDIIYCHSSKAGALGRIANIGLNNKVIYNPHGWAFNMQCSSKKRTVYKWIEKILARITTAIVAISDYEKESAIQQDVCSESKIKVIYNGIDINKFDTMKEDYTITRELLGIPEDAYVIGAVGRLSKQKAPDIFFKVAEKVSREIDKVHFLWVGDGEDRDQIEALIKEYNLHNCTHITGWVQNPLEYIQLFDQAALVSRWEGFGLVLTEYMYAKKPIVATKIDAIPNLIQHGKNGLLCEVDDVDGIAEAMMKIYEDKQLAKDLGKSGNLIVRQKYSIERVVCQHYNLFEQVEV